MRVPSKKSSNNVFMDYNNTSPDTKDFSCLPPTPVRCQAITSPGLTITAVPLVQISDVLSVISSQV
jgi:hypothetical protein